MYNRHALESKWIEKLQIYPPNGRNIRTWVFMYSPHFGQSSPQFQVSLSRFISYLPISDHLGVLALHCIVWETESMYFCCVFSGSLFNRLLNFINCPTPFVFISAFVYIYDRDLCDSSVLSYRAFQTPFYSPQERK